MVGMWKREKHKFFRYRIRIKDIERYNGKFVTSFGFKVRETDIIYKIKKQ